MIKNRHMEKFKRVMRHMYKDRQMERFNRVMCCRAIRYQ
jgi:hypothetical protein